MSKKVIDNIRNIYSLFGLITFIALLFIIIISYVQILYYYPSFNIFSNWMSELGVGPNYIIFNVCIMLTTILLGFFYFGVIKRIKKKGVNHRMSNICLFCGIFSLIGLAMIAIFPMEDIGKSTLFHGIAALIYWSGSVCFWGLLILMEKQNPLYDLRVRIIVLLTFISWSVFLCIFLISVLVPIINENLPIVFQWIAHFFNLLSILSLALNMRKE